MYGKIPSDDGVLKGPSHPSVYDLHVELNLHKRKHVIHPNRVLGYCPVADIRIIILNYTRCVGVPTDVDGVFNLTLNYGPTAVEVIQSSGRGFRNYAHPAFVICPMKMELFETMRLKRP
jgi:hypothetical protein